MTDVRSFPGQPAQVAQRFSKQGGGEFTKPRNDSKEWVETNAGGSSRVEFVEIGRDKDWIRLFDPTRNKTVSLPVNGGKSNWSTDGGKTWHDLVVVAKAR